MILTIRLSIACIVTLVLTLGGTSASAAEQWVSRIATSDTWSAFPCTDYWITNVCGIDKGFGDPGSLPPTIKVGDTIQYVNTKGKSVQFSVRSISYFVFDKDIDTTWGGTRLTARKGDTTCSLYDIRARSNMDYASKITVKGCRLVEQ